MLEPSEAWRRIDERISVRDAERVSRCQAIGRRLSTALHATLDTPPNDVSAMDGFAFAGTLETGQAVPVVATIAAGDEPGATLDPGCAARIMTGAPVPSGTDRVVPFELTEMTEQGVVVDDAGQSGQHIRRRGEISSEGQVILQPGHCVTPGTAGLLATHGIEQVDVISAPRVAYLTTGSEVVDPSTEPGPGQIRDSHSDFFAGALASLDVPSERLGIAPDDKIQLAEMIRDGRRRDVLLLSGGVSMGDFVLVEGVLDDAGCEILVDAVAIQPGKPLVAAQHEHGWVFGLPGNPASAMVTFWLFVRPALRRMMGHDDAYWRGALDARLGAELPGAKGRDRFLPAQITIEDGAVQAHPINPVGSHDVSAYGYGNALVRIPRKSAPRPPGDSCSVLPIG